MPSSAVLALVLLTASAVSSRAPAAFGITTQGRADGQFEEYIALLVGVGAQALREPRLAAPMPCLAHWLAGNDHIVVAVSDIGGSAGLSRSDALARIGSRELTGARNGLWDVALRALPRDVASYDVEILRRGRRLRLMLPCASARATAMHQAERAMWTAVTRRGWAECIAKGREMLDAFGAEASPPLMVMAQCASASGMPEARLTNSLGRALLAELVSHPAPQPDLRQQLFLALRELEAIRASGGEDYATSLRAEMVSVGVEPQAR